LALELEVTVRGETGEGNQERSTVHEQLQADAFGANRRSSGKGRQLFEPRMRMVKA
jgi:hypothetical protein